MAESPPQASEPERQRAVRTGLAYGLAAYAMWGVFPIYFHALAHVSPWLIVCHRVFWSVLFLAIGAGAIAQVILQIGKQTARDMPATRFFAEGHVMAGLFAGFAVMYATGMLVV